MKSVETVKERLIRRLKLVIELYDEDEYVHEVAREALRYLTEAEDQGEKPD